MAEFWEEFWESRYRQRHGHASQGDRADLERQIAFVDDLVVHPTAETNMNMVAFLISDLNEDILEQRWKDGTIQRIIRAQTDLVDLHDRLYQLQHIAREAGTDLIDAILQQLGRVCAESRFSTNYGISKGPLPTVPELTAPIEKAMQIVIEKYSRQCARSIRGCRSPLFSGSSSETLNERLAHACHVPTQDFEDGFDSLAQSSPAFDETEPCFSSNQHYADSLFNSNESTRESFQSNVIRDESCVFPHFESTRLAITPTKEEQNSQTGHIAKFDHLQYSNSTGSSISLNTPTCAPERECPLSQNAEPIEHDDNSSYIQTFSWAKSLSWKFESEADLESTSSSNSLPISWPDMDVSNCSTPVFSHGAVLKPEPCCPAKSVNADGPQNVSEVGVFGSGTDSAAYLVRAHAYKCAEDMINSKTYETMQRFEQQVLQTATNCWLPPAEIGIFGSDIDSAEYLANAHSWKYDEDTANGIYYRHMQRHEQEMHQIAADCLIPPISHRRLPNIYAALSIQGDGSLLAYEGHVASSQGSASATELDAREPAHTHLRGGSCFSTFSPTVSDTFSCSGLLFAYVFINSRGNEYFCDIDEDYLTDRFNLTSLNTEVQYYQYALDLITDVLDIDVDDETREQIEKSARHLYGLVHARYIVTTRGLQKMCEKYKKGDFGKCPRVACDGQPLLPMGQHDSANLSAVKLYCGRCEDLYNPKSSRHSSVDGAYFGSSFHNMFFQIYPNLMPQKSSRRYEPKIFGFKVHAPATLARWQSLRLEEVKETLRLEGLETGYEDEEREDEIDGSDDEDEVGQDGIDDMFEGQRVAY